MASAAEEPAAAASVAPLSLYLDSSAILRPVLEQGLSPEVERQIEEAEILITSRLSLVETACAFLSVRLLGEHPEAVVAHRRDSGHPLSADELHAASVRRQW